MGQQEAMHLGGWEAAPCDQLGRRGVLRLKTTWTASCLRRDEAVLIAPKARSLGRNSIWPSGDTKAAGSYAAPVRILTWEMSYSQ